jgi:hypothetical protein
MAAITVTTERARLIESVLGATHEAGVAITAGQAIHLNSSEKWVLADATAAGNAAGVHIALKSAGAGAGLTGLKIGEVAGIDVALAPGSPVFLSNTPGGLDTAAGTVSVQVGRVTKPGLYQVICPI